MQTKPQEVLAIAQKIYQIWQSGGPEGLQQYFVSQLEIPGKLAARFAELYIPAGEPILSDKKSVAMLSSRHITKKVFHDLRLQMTAEGEASGYGTIWPKNLLGWYVLQQVYGSDHFDFMILGETGKQHDNYISFPNYFVDEKGNCLPLGEVAAVLRDFSEVPAHVARKSLILKDLLGDSVTADLARAMLSADILFPPRPQVRALADVISRGLRGEKVVVTGIFCPDYSYEETGNPSLPYRYTFEGVADGVGLVAQRVAKILPSLVGFFQKHNIAYEIQLTIADFEADSQDVLDRVRLGRQEFTELCKGSLIAFQNHLPDLDMGLFLFKEHWSNGQLSSYQQAALDSMQGGSFGRVKENSGKQPQFEVGCIVEAGIKSNFYQEWFGKELTRSDLQQIVLSQAAEYAATGKIIAERFAGRPMIQLAGDRPKMQIFNNFYDRFPVLCTKRVY